MKQFRIVIYMNGEKIIGGWLNPAEWTIKRVLDTLDFTKWYPNYYFEYR